jgi:signal transduction histidine kinase/CheY-like chemotaxis protein
VTRSPVDFELELEDHRVLQEVSTELVGAEGVPVCFDMIVDAATRIMRADFASLQSLQHRESGDELHLVAHRNFTREGAEYWERVRVGQDCACGTALRTGRRIVVRDIEDCEFMAGTEDLEKSKRVGIASVQSTPLVSRRGRLLGMISTHWRKKHAPEERELRLIDVLARQTADYIERKQTERQREELLASESVARIAAEREARLKDEFLATLSHELRTPLTAIMGWAHILKSDPASRERVLAAADTIERNGHAQVKLITDLLDISRIVAGKLRLELEEVDFVAVVDAAVEGILPLAASKALRIVKLVDGPAESVQGDPARLQQVVGNLLSNAVKFTPRGGRIEISLARVEDTMVLRVVDTGVGVAREFLPHVFDRFRQGDSTTARQHGGLGLGLAIVKQLTELHGGFVRASSDGVGQGATFVVALPLTTVGGSAGARRAPESSPPLSGSIPPTAPALDGASVLVVDDDPDTLGVVVSLLSRCGARVEAAPSAEAALALVAEGRFDVLVSDIGMPGGDGYQLMAELRARGIETPAVALTAFARGDDRARALESGFREHVTKPIEPARLLEAVERLVAAARSTADATLRTG